MNLGILSCSISLSVCLMAGVDGFGKDQTSLTSSNRTSATRIEEVTSKDRKNETAEGLRRGPTVEGEAFTVRQIIDRKQGLPVCVFVAPEKWRDQSQVIWNYADNSSPVKVGVAVGSPTNDEAFFAYPAAEFFCLRPDAGYYRVGQNFGGLIYTQQAMRPALALLGFVQQTRGAMPGFSIVGMRELPDLPKALNVVPAGNQSGIGIKVKYQVKDKPVEEEFYAVHYAIEIPYDGPQGRTWQINWGLNALHSFRAPEGSLEQRKSVFAAIAKSFRPNPAWYERLGAIRGYLQEQFNRQLQAGYDQIAAAGALSRQISANNDAMIGTIDQRLAAARNSTGRAANEKFSDYIRGVETLDDPYYGTSQHSIQQQYHWTDGYGSYRNSNDSAYNPNQSESGDWKLMTPLR